MDFSVVKMSPLTLTLRCGMVFSQGLRSANIHYQRILSDGFILREPVVFAISRQNYAHNTIDFTISTLSLSTTANHSDVHQ